MTSGASFLSRTIGRFSRAATVSPSPAAPTGAHGGDRPSHFLLDDGSDFSLDERATITPRWMELPHAPERERALIVIAGEQLQAGPFTAPREPTLWLRCMRGLPQISLDGLGVVVELVFDDGRVAPVLTLAITNDSPLSGLNDLTMALPILPGEGFSLRLRCEPGPQGRPEADWLALCGLVVSAREDVSGWRARSQSAWRLENEIAHFTSVYQGAFYADRQQQRGGADVGPLRPLPVGEGDGHDDPQALLRGVLRARVADLAPRPDENAFSFAHRALQLMMNQTSPDFAARLTALAARLGDRPLRMLALCAGEAAIEGRILDRAGVPVSLCIVDVNTAMLDRAAERMPANVRVDRVVGDANLVGRQLGEFDVVVITSGLHHLIELEKVLSSIAGLLAAGGEFWLIGEQVGRNGNRLWPEGRDEAERLFASWPEHKRRNANTGLADVALPDRDFSSGCFEGIRSEEILGLLARHFLPAEVFLYDAFLWRLVDVAYSGNFDTALAADRELLIEAALAEAVHWSCGGRGTALHAAYRSKLSEVLHA